MNTTMKQKVDAAIAQCVASGNPAAEYAAEVLSELYARYHSLLQLTLDEVMKDEANRRSDPAVGSELASGSDASPSMADQRWSESTAANVARRIDATAGVVG